MRNGLTAIACIQRYDKAFHEKRFERKVFTFYLAYFSKETS